MLGIKKDIGVYGLLQRTSSESQIAIPSILTFGPRVSLISTENFIIVFLQLFQEALQRTRAIILLKGLLLAVISPTKPKSASLT
jgi:hypothetical protein